MTDALYDDDNNFLDPAAYKEIINNMNLKYNKTWLMTERNNAIAGSQMASRWNTFTNEKKEFPYLKYQTVGDDNVRNDHRILDGIVKPVDDPFWKTYYPPNGWGCRCDVIQVTGNEKETSDDKITKPWIQPMFRTNLADHGLIFPQDHPYYFGVPRKVIIEAIGNIPAENGYLKYKADNKKIIKAHVLHGEIEIDKNISLANDLAVLGAKDIRLLPDLNDMNDLKPLFYPESFKPVNISKNPDAVITWRKKIYVTDLKVLDSKKQFYRRLGEAAEQGEFAIIKFTIDVKERDLISNIRKRLKEKENLKGVLIIDRDGKIITEIIK